MVSKSKQHIIKFGSACNFAVAFRKKLIENQTPSETLFLNFLRNKNIGFRFQKIIQYKPRNKFFVVDFYLKKFNTIIEIDGMYHYSWDQVKKDEKRDSDIMSRTGASIIRIDNKLVESLDIMHYLIDHSLQQKRTIINKISLQNIISLL